MRSWESPAWRPLPGRGGTPRIFDQASGALQPVSNDGRTCSVYVCGITPYDATHLGHASTYLAYDVLLRQLKDAGIATVYAQNVTDVDDPLLERATQTEAEWRALADSQTDLYRTDMQYLRVLPPDHFEAVTDNIDAIGEAVLRLVEDGLAYRVASDDAEEDIYFDVAQADRQLPCWSLGEETGGLSQDMLMRMFAEHGGDPSRRGKRDRLDPLLWRAARQAEPSWHVPGLPEGRPGWHIECSVIAADALGCPFDVQGGGADLIFPHHDMCAAHAAALTGLPMARLYSHTALVAYHGAKMSKSLGNLVFVRDLRERGVSPDAIRVAVGSHPYRHEWEWRDGDIDAAVRRLDRWRSAYQSASTGPASGSDAVPPIVDQIRARLADDLDVPGAYDALDRWTRRPESATIVGNAVWNLLGIELNGQTSTHGGGKAEA